jgi:hypothetical protein
MTMNFALGLMKRGLARVACAVGLALAIPAWATVRDVTLNVTVNTATGVAVEKIAVRAWTTEGAVFGVTNAQGMVSIVVKLDDTDEFIRAGLSPVAPGVSVPDSDRKPLAQKYCDVTELDSFPKEKVVAVPAQASSVSLTISGRAAIVVEGHAVAEEDGTEAVAVVPQLLDAMPPGKLMAEFAQPAADFELKGVPKDRASVILLARYDASAFKLIRVTANQASENIDLGDVAVPGPDVGETVSVTVNNRTHAALKRDAGSKYAVTAISTNGTSACSFALNNAGVARPTMLRSGSPKLPTGSYYLIPGALTDEPARRVLAAIDNGTNMVPVGLSIFTVQAGGSVPTATVDAADVLSKIWTHLPSPQW